MNINMNITKNILLILLLIIILIYLFNNISNYPITNNDPIIKHILNKNECEHIINIGNKYKYSLDLEPVDDLPLYQIDIFNKKILNKELWNTILPIYNNKILHLLNNDELILDFVFFRRYTTEERKDISIHTDNNQLSINLLLSDNKDFHGGDFYIFDKKNTRKYIDYYDSVLQNNENKKKEFISSFKKLPIVNLNQGDIIIYSGKEHLHGVLPVINGTRYIISFFFE